MDERGGEREEEERMIVVMGYATKFLIRTLLVCDLQLGVDHSSIVLTCQSATRRTRDRQSTPE